MSVRNGGAAFPFSRTIGEHGYRRVEYADGMSLRDWFAGQALAGLVTMWDDAAAAAPDLVADAYIIADEMLAERAESEG